MVKLSKEKILNFGEQILFYLLVFLLPINVGWIIFRFAPELTNVYTLGIIYLTDVLILALFGILILKLGLKKILFKETWQTFGKAIFRLEWGYFFLFAFVVLVLVSAFFASQISAAFYQALKTIEFFALAIYLRSNFGRFNLKILAFILILAAVLQGVFIFNLYRQPEFLRSTSVSKLSPLLTSTTLARGAGSFEHPNLLAVFLGLSLLLVLGLILERKFPFDFPNPERLNLIEEKFLLKEVLKRIFLVVIFFFLIFTLGLSFSRALILGTILMMILFLAFLFFDKKTADVFQKKIFYSLFLILFFSLLMGLVLWPEMKARFEAIDFQISSLIKAPQGFSLLRENPRLGLGPGNYVLTILKTKPLLPDQVQPINNLFWHLGVELGLATLIVFLIFWFWLGLKLFQTARRIENLSLRLWGWALLSSWVFITGSFFFVHFYFTLQGGRLIFWILVGIMMYFLRQSQNRKILANY